MLNHAKNVLKHASSRLKHANNIQNHPCNGLKMLTMCTFMLELDDKTTARTYNEQNRLFAGVDANIVIFISMIKVSILGVNRF